MKILVAITTLLLALPTFGQQQMNNWYFGQNAGLDFTSGAPIAITNGAMVTDEGCASVSDQSGSLLFLTNGVSVWDNNQNLMPNGSGLLGSLSSSQSTLIVPKPGSSTIYYIFTTAAQADTAGVNYSEVDLTLNGGTGDVNSNKNIQLLSPVCEKISVGRHGNNVDFWVVVHAWNSNAFYSYLVSSSGVSTVPVISNTGAVITGTGNNIEAIGCMKVSIDGTHLALANYGDRRTVLFDFDNFSGRVNNPQVLNSRYVPYGIEFSATSNLLYVSEWGFGGSDIYQYDLSAANIRLSQTVIGSINYQSQTAASLQLGPDCKIYMAIFGSSFLSQISKPDIIGTGCNFIANGIGLGGSTSRAGLPLFIPYALNCEIVQGFDEITEATVVEVFPNPSYDQPTIRFENSLNAAVSLTLYDDKGSIVRQLINIRTTEVLIHREDLQDGLYFYQLTRQGQILATGKFVLQ